MQPDKDTSDEKNRIDSKSFSFKTALNYYFFSVFLVASHVDENRRNDSAKPQTSLKTEHEQTENLTSTSVRENL